MTDWKENQKPAVFRSRFLQKAATWLQFSWHSREMLTLDSDSNSVLLEEYARVIKNSKDSFILIGETLEKVYYHMTLLQGRKSFLEWTKREFNFSKTSTYEYMTAFKIYKTLKTALPAISPPIQSHCLVLSKVPQEKRIDAWGKAQEIPELSVNELREFLESHGYFKREVTKGKSGNHTSLKLPFDVSLVQSMAQAVVLGEAFDIYIQSETEFLACKKWYGRIWCFLAAEAMDCSAGNLDFITQIIISKYKMAEFNEGLFLIRAQMGADWCEPLLHYPYCILRHIVGISRPDFPQRPDAFLVFYLGPNVGDFYKLFGALGVIPGLTTWSAANI